MPPTLDSWPLSSAVAFGGERTDLCAAGSCTVARSTIRVGAVFHASALPPQPASSSPRNSAQRFQRRLDCLERLVVRVNLQHERRQFSGNKSRNPFRETPSRRRSHDLTHVCVPAACLGEITDVRGRLWALYFHPEVFAEPVRRAPHASGVPTR